MQQKCLGAPNQFHNETLFEAPAPNDSSRPSRRSAPVQARSHKSTIKLTVYKSELCKSEQRPKARESMHNLIGNTDGKGLLIVLIAVAGMIGAAAGLI